MASRDLGAQIVKFLLTGGVAAAANIVVGILVRHFISGELGLDVSVGAGFAVGTAVSFVLNRQVTFAATATAGRLSGQVGRYAAAAAVGWGITTVAATLALRLFHWVIPGYFTEGTVETMAHVSAIGLNTIYSFVAIKYFALRTPSPSSDVPRAS